MTPEKDLQLPGYAGKDIWLDPESKTFARFHYGSFQQLSEVSCVLLLTYTMSLIGSQKLNLKN